jgi:hypothetical protein
MFGRTHPRLIRLSIVSIRLCNNSQVKNWTRVSPLMLHIFLVCVSIYGVFRMNWYADCVENFPKGCFVHMAASTCCCSGVMSCSSNNNCCSSCCAITVSTLVCCIIHHPKLKLCATGILLWVTCEYKFGNCMCSGVDILCHVKIECLFLCSIGIQWW